MLTGFGSSHVHHTLTKDAQPGLLAQGLQTLLFSSLLKQRGRMMERCDSPALHHTIPGVGEPHTVKSLKTAFLLQLLPSLLLVSLPQVLLEVNNTKHKRMPCLDPTPLLPEVT